MQPSAGLSPGTVSIEPSARLSFYDLSRADTLQNRVDRGTLLYGTAENKNIHAVKLGEMTSPAKAAAAARNGEKGGRPKGS